MAGPTATGLIQFIHYALKADYIALGSYDPSTLYLIQDSGEVFLGDKPYGVSVEFGAALPPKMFSNKLYVITSAGETKFYKFDGANIVELKISGTGAAGTVTPDSSDIFTNKTINAGDNEIENLRVDNFAVGVVLDDISAQGGVGPDTLPTTNAVYNLIAGMMTIKHFL